MSVSSKYHFFIFHIPQKRLLFHTGALGKITRTVRTTAGKGTSYEAESVITLLRRREVIARSAKGWPMRRICAATRDVLLVSQCSVFH